MALIPPRVSCLSQKGGGGKTTMATNLAVASAGAGVATLLLDLDPQQSSVRAWANWRADRKPRVRVPLTVQGIGWDNLEATLTAAGKKHKLIVLDTPGQKGNVSNYCAGVSNIVLVTVQPSMLDLATISETMGLNNVMNRPAFVVFNRVMDKAALAEAREVVEARGYRCAPVAMSNLSVYRDAIGEGLGVLEYDPKGATKAVTAELTKARREISDLYAWVQKEITANPTIAGKNRNTEWGDR